MISHPIPGKPPGAFTLTEVLVGVAIVATLAALFLPVSQGFLEKSKSVNCISNLRQIGAALHMYAGENNGDLPPQRWWTGASPPALSMGSSPNGLGYLLTGGYLGPAVDAPTGTARGKVLECPSKNGRKFFRQQSNWCSYVYQNPFYLPSGALDPNRPQKTMLLRAAWALVIDAGQVFANNPPTHAASKARGMTAVLYADSHAQLQPWIGTNGQSVEAWPYRFDLENQPRN